MNYIFEYYQAIRSGKIIVSRWIESVFSMLVHGIEDGTYTFDASKANRAITFIESFCHHCKGRCDLLRLELWQKAIVSAIFGILDNEGNRNFREVVIILARKNGKSLFAAAIAAYCAFCDGEYGADVYCVAPKLDQADIVYSSIWQTVEAEPELQEMIKRRKTDYYIQETNTTIKKIAFNAKKSDGFNPHLTICDEFASWQGDQGLKQYEVMKSAVGSRRQPLILSISTAGYINEGIYDELFKRATRFLSGDSRETRLLPFIYQIDDVQRWNDINELRKSNPNLGVSISVDYLLEEIAIAEGSLSKKAEFMTKYACHKQTSSQAWLKEKDIERSSGAGLKIEDFEKSYAVIGIDLSRAHDLTAATCVIERNGEYYVFGKAWLPTEKIEEATARDKLPYEQYIKRGWLAASGDTYVDYKDVTAWIVELVRKHKILPMVVGYDRYSATYLIDELKTMGLKCDDVFQGENLTPVINEMEAIVKAGKIHIGDNALLKAHMYNSGVKVNSETERCRLVKIYKNDHIDYMAALLDAFTVRQKWYGEYGRKLKNER